MLNTKKLILKILNSLNILSVNYITEEGTDNNWKYRKWNNGRCEAWNSTLDLGTLSPTTWVAPIRYVDANVAMPTLFIAEPEPVVVATSQTPQWWVVRCDVQSPKLAIRLATVASSSQRAIIEIYMFGRWK